MQIVIKEAAVGHGESVGRQSAQTMADGDVATRRSIAEQLGNVLAGLDRLAPHLDGEVAGLEALQVTRQAALRCVGLIDRLAADAGEPAAAEPDAAANGRTVLAVDDNAALRRVVVRQLRDLGYRVLEADDGPAALMILNSEPVDLLFTDVVMPGGMSGFDLARLVLSRWPQMKALITSGFPEIEPHSDSAVAGKLRRLIKPYRKADLARTLQEVLDPPEANPAGDR